ncbi:MAG TPA: ABC transporter permease [Mucilaginibacter sp.]|nr:ABC transporter permease [Mucilaginibacter sp.]
MIKNYLKIAWRNFTKDRQFSILNLIGLSTGLACALLIYLWINDELKIGRFNEKDSQLYQVMVNGHWPDGIQTGENSPGLLARSMKEELPEVEYAVATIHPGGLTNDKGIFINGANRAEATAIFAGKDLFDVFSYKLIDGNKDNVLTRPDGVVLSDEMARKLFHTTQNVVGRQVTWNQTGLSGTYLITGVFKKLPATSLDQFDVVFNYDYFLSKNPKLTNWQNNDPYTYLILKKGTDIQGFNNKIVNFVKSKDKDSHITLFVQRYGDKYLFNHYKDGAVAGGRIEYIKLFSAIAIFILVMACINFTNLSTAKASARLKEAGIRKVMGAKRITLITQYISESLLMAFIALMFAVLMVIALLPQFNLVTGKQIVLQPNLALILSAAGITLVTGLVSGLYPALFISGFKPTAVLKSGTSASAGHSWIRKGLVVFQFSLSAVFIVSVLVIYAQMQLIQTKNLGYNRDNILYFEKGGLVSDNADDYKPGGKYDQDLSGLINEVKNIPDVISAANFRHNITNRHGGTTDLTWPGEAPGTNISFTDIASGYGFIETLGIQLKEGRPFSAKFHDNNSKIILNEAAVEAMGLKDPIGKTVHLWGSDRQIIGITKNFNFESLYESLKPCFFDFTFGNRASKIMVKIKAGTEKETIARLEALYHQYNPGLPFEYRFLDEDYQQLYASEERVAVLSKYFAGLAIIISCLGLFGLAAFTAQKRQKEISIRKVVGASATNVLVMLSRDLLKLVLLAIIVTFPVAWWLASNWLRNFAYHIDINASIFIVTGAAMTLITAATISYQSVKAALANPVKSLRSE